jgi:hypothetical protein
MGVVVERDVMVPMRDGARLCADVYRPAGEGPFPALVHRTPYDRTSERNRGFAEAMAARGYIVVVQDIRGRYGSDGEFDPFYSPTLGNACIDDGYDTIEWAARLPDCTGGVGTYGCSYDAWTQWKLAPMRPPALRAMFAGGMCPDSRSVWPGIFTRDRQLQWIMNTMAPDTRRRAGLPGPKSVEEASARWFGLDLGKWLWFEPLAEIPAEAVGGLARDWAYWVSHQHVNWYAFDHDHAEIDVPIYHFTAWYDRLIETIDQYTGMVANGRTERARASQRLIVGPWTHGYNFSRQVGILDFGADAEMEFAGVMAPWFDHWLKGQSAALMDKPPIRLFVMGANRWRWEHEWPLARTRFTSYYLHSGGGANTPRGDGTLSTSAPGEEPHDAYTYDPRDPLMSLYLPSAQAGPCDVRVHDERRDMLVYQTPPLERDTEVTGPIELHLFAASSAPDADWTARLVDVYPDGFGVNLGYGICRARYRESFENPSLLEPGRVYEYRIAIKPTSNLFKAGHRIRLDISSSDFPNFDRNHNTGGDDWADARMQPAHQRVFHDGRYPSRLVLPIVPA